MPIAEAVSLVERGDGPSFHQEAHCPADDMETLIDLAIWSQRFSPLVGWETVASKTLDASIKRSAAARNARSIDFLLLDIAGLGHLFGSEAGLAHRVMAAFQRRSYYPSVAIASSIGAAWALARYGAFHRPALPRCQVWYPEQESRQLGALPLEALRAPAEAVQSLQRLGLSRVAQLEQLPRNSLRSRFGPELLLRLEQLRGEAPETLAPYQPPASFNAVWVCDPPTSRRDNLEQALLRLTEHVASLLYRSDQGAIRLQCVIRRRDEPAIEMQVELFQPTCSGEHLYDLLRMQLEQTQMSGAATRIELNAALAAPLKVRQEELFQDGSRQRTRQFSMLLNRLSVRLGGQCVLQPRRTADPQPERSCVLEAAHSGVRARRKRKASGKARQQDREIDSPEINSSERGLPRGQRQRLGAAHRPLTLYEPPRRIETTAVIPDGPPIRFEDRRRLHRVAKHWGPERIETGWWRGPSVRRDYYRVETEEGRRYWLFRELSEDRWFLHGVFN